MPQGNFRCVRLSKGRKDATGISWMKDLKCSITIGDFREGFASPAQEDSKMSAALVKQHILKSDLIDLQLDP